MYPYRYTVSLRLWHPKRDLAPAAIVFGLRPSRVWKQGEPRKTPKGTPMPGVFANSYWTARLVSERGVSSKRQSVEAFVLRTVERLRDRRAFIGRLRKSGGRAELFVGLFGTRNFAVELESSVLQAAARLGLAMGFDIYPTK